MVDANQSGCLFVGEGVILKGNFALSRFVSDQAGQAVQITLLD